MWKHKDSTSLLPPFAIFNSSQGGAETGTFRSVIESNRLEHFRLSWGQTQLQPPDKQSPICGLSALGSFSLSCLKGSNLSSCSDNSVITDESPDFWHKVVKSSIIQGSATSSNLQSFRLRLIESGNQLADRMYPTASSHNPDLKNFSAPNAISRFSSRFGQAPNVL